MSKLNRCANKSLNPALLFCLIQNTQAENASSNSDVSSRSFLVHDEEALLEMVSDWEFILLNDLLTRKHRLSGIAPRSSSLISLVLFTKNRCFRNSDHRLD